MSADTNYTDFDNLSEHPKHFVVRGTVEPSSAHAGRVAWLNQPATGVYQWDHQKHVAVFANRDAALAAARSCNGPLFMLPDPDTITVEELL